jgi:hypothetical protein
MPLPRTSFTSKSTISPNPVVYDGVPTPVLGMSLPFVAHVLNSRTLTERVTLRNGHLSGRHFADGSIIHDHLNALG